MGSEGIWRIKTNKCVCVGAGSGEQPARCCSGRIIWYAEWRFGNFWRNLEGSFNFSAGHVVRPRTHGLSLRTMMILWHYDIHPSATDLRDFLKKINPAEKKTCLCVVLLMHYSAGWVFCFIWGFFLAESKRMFNKEPPWKLCNTSVLCNVIYPVIYKLLAAAPRA